MKIAALVRAYHRPGQLDVLLNRLGGDLWAPYVHIDRKSDIGQFATSRDKATFLENRVQVNWGGLTQVEATIRLLRAALLDPTITHFYQMSGQCYPVKSDEQIQAAIAKFSDGSANLIELVAMPVSHKLMNRYSSYWLHDVQNPIAWRILAQVFPRLPERSPEKLRGIKLYGGGCWWLMERDAIERILKFLDENRWYWRLFRFSDIPDEMLFHSLIAPLGIRVGGTSPTGDTWIQGNPHPETLTEPMHEAYVAGPALFARKYVDFHPALAVNDPASLADDATRAARSSRSSAPHTAPPMISRSPAAHAAHL